MIHNKNTPGLGIEYEVYLPAYFALTLNNKEEVQDFTIRSNVQEFGNLDDLVIDIKTTNDQLHFGFQLKHKENLRKNLLPTYFEAKGDFNLEKYYKAFKTLKEDSKKYNFILYTNINFVTSKTKDVTKFKIIEYDSCNGQPFFDTSSQGNIYKFQINEDTAVDEKLAQADFKQFLSQFTLYTSQKNYKELDKDILEIIKYKEQFTKYIDFFRRWHRGEFTNKILDKNTLNLHLVDIFLSPFILTYHFTNNLETFQLALQEFDITIIPSTKSNFFKEINKCERLEDFPMLFPLCTKVLDEHMPEYEIDPQELATDQKSAIKKCVFFLAKSYKFIDKYAKKIDQDMKLKIFCYFFHIPLIICFQEMPVGLINQTFELYKGSKNRIAFVLLGKGIESKQFSRFQVFETLQDLFIINARLFDEIIKKCLISLQGRKKISLNDFIDHFEEVVDIVGPKEIVQMMNNAYLLGEQKETLPQFYVNRTVSTYVFHLEMILRHCFESKDIIIVYFINTSFKEQITKNGIKIVEIQLYLQQNLDVPDEATIVSSNFEESIYMNFEKIRQKNKKQNIFCLKMVDPENFTLIMSTQNTFRTKKPKMKKKSIEEKLIHTYFNNPINILCAGPGMGKSTFFKYLRNEYSSEWWIISIDLKKHNTFLREKKKILEVLHHFIGEETDSFLKQLKNIFLKNKKIVMLMDGLDEIESRNIYNVLQYCKEFSTMGFKIWISTRPNLQYILEDYFQLFVIEIDDLNDDQQKTFVKNRLKSKYLDEQVEEITNKIFERVDIVNNRKMLGIPLQLHIITQIFLDDIKQYENLNQNSFVLTNMYKCFFEGRYQHSIAKLNCENPHLMLKEFDDRLEKYQTLALETLFSEEIFMKLMPSFLLERNRRFLMEIQREGDPIGIIVRVDDKNRAVFEHFTFAEYFASLFLTKNFDHVQIFKDCLFNEKYQNLLTIFNIMLAEENSLLLAVIYKDVGQIQSRLVNHGATEVDKGGRSLMHILASVGTRHPVLRFSGNKFKDNIVKSFDGEISSVKEMVQLLMELKWDIFHTDNIFQWTPFNYALVTGSLYLVEEFLDKYDAPTNFHNLIRKYFDDENIVYYSLRLGYPKLLSVVLSNKNLHLTDITCSSLENSFIDHSIICFCFMPPCVRKMEVIKVLLDQRKKNINFIQRLLQKFLKNGINRFLTFHNELLHFAVMFGDLPLTSFLLEQGANVNFRTDFGQPLLFLPVEQENFEMTSLLLRKGAKVNCRDNSRHVSLHYAAKTGNIEIMQLLLDNGANVNARNSDGKCVAAFSARTGNFDATDFLLKNGTVCEKDILCEAARGGNIRLLEALIKRGFDVNEKNKHGQTPLHKAILAKKLDVVRFLLANHADVNLVTNEGDTVLHYLGYQPSEIGSLLISKASHLLITYNAKGISPLSMFVYRGHVELVDLLLKQTVVDLDKINLHDSNYPLVFAVENGHLKKERLLEMALLIKNSQK